MMQSPEKQLQMLLDLVFDGSCTDDQRREFAKLIDDHPPLISKLSEEAFVHSLLLWQAECGIQDFSAQELSTEILNQLDEFQTSASDSVQSPASGSTSSSPAARRAWRAATLWAIAASLLIGVGALWLGMSSSNENQPVYAKITTTKGVVWTADTPRFAEGDSLGAGRLQLDSGEITMNFRSGPVVRVTGPASLMVESDMLVHLTRGQATARVPDGIKGFTITTPVIDVVDQGTEFGVATRSNGFTDVIVFDGKVDLRESINTEGKPTRLVQGEGARVDRLGSLERIMHVGRNNDGGWWTADYPTAGGPEDGVNVIQEVRDNIPPADGLQYFCYQVTYHGFREDAFAYADHPHQWNGLTSDGLPAFLQGADYVKTFNDYRYLNDFEMEVMLARPANLYVLFDNRVPLPEWLTSQFEDTQIDIGLDEGYWQEIPDHANAEGAGNSIDTIFSVWHRTCAEPETVALGPVGASDEARAMYGVAATPLLVEEPTRVDRQVRGNARERKVQLAVRGKEHQLEL